MYTWTGMTKIDYDQALDRFRMGKPVYLLYQDNSECLVETITDIEDHHDDGGEFGFEKE